jgi:hypothetical protein
MNCKYLSIVHPNGTRIAKGEKTIEVRTWVPDLNADEDLLIVENTRFLRNEDEIDPNGTPVALVKVKNFREYVKQDIPATCASRWEPGYFSWELYDVRPISTDKTVVAARGIYELEIELP